MEDRSLSIRGCRRLDNRREQIRYLLTYLLPKVLRSIITQRLVSLHVKWHKLIRFTSFLFTMAITFVSMSEFNLSNLRVPTSWIPLNYMETEKNYTYLYDYLRNRRWGGCVYVLQMLFSAFLFFFAFSVSHKNTRQPFSGTAERIFMKILPNDSGENVVFNVVPKLGLGPKYFLGAKNYTLRIWCWRLASDSELVCWLWHCAATAVALKRHEGVNAFNLVVFTISCKTKNIVANVNKCTVTTSGSQRHCVT